MRKWGGETGGSEELIQAGAVAFALEYRTLHEGAEEGVCIHVHGGKFEGPTRNFYVSTAFASRAITITETLR
jgi:hypothetical protein